MKKKIKKIGWLKFTGNLEIGEHLLFTAGTTNIRTNIFKEILEEDIELILYSPVGVASGKYLETKEGKELFGKLKIKYCDKIEDDIDFLIVENGTDNTNFSWNLNERSNVTSVAYSNKLISSYSGVCFYFQTDPDLSFIFLPEFLSMKYINNHIKDGNFKSLLENKKFVILSSAKKEQEFINANSNLRASYSELIENKLINYEFLESHFSCLETSSDFKIKRKPKQITYIGGQRVRMKKFNKFISLPSEEGVPFEVWGKWKEDFISKNGSVEWKGVLGRGLVNETYNDSFGSIIIGDPSFEKMGYISGRFFEVIASKTLPLIDVDLLESTISDLLDTKLLNELTLKNSNDVTEKYNKLVGSDYRIDLIKECLKSVKGYNSKRILQNLFSIFYKYEEKENKNVGLKFDKKVNSVFEKFLEQRDSQNSYSKSFYNTFLRKLYKQYNKTGNDLFSTDIYKLEKEGVGHDDILSFPKDKRCSRCGSKIDLSGKSVFVSNSVCFKCKNNEGNQIKRKEKNIIKQSKKIKNGKK